MNKEVYHRRRSLLVTISIPRNVTEADGEKVIRGILTDALAEFRPVVGMVTNTGVELSDMPEPSLASIKPPKPAKWPGTAPQAPKAVKPTLPPRPVLPPPPVGRKLPPPPKRK